MSISNLSYFKNYINCKKYKNILRIKYAIYKFFLLKETKNHLIVVNNNSKKLTALFNGLCTKINNLTTFYNRITWVDDFDYSCFLSQLLRCFLIQI